ADLRPRGSPRIHRRAPAGRGDAGVRVRGAAVAAMDQPAAHMTDTDTAIALRARVPRNGFTLDVDLQLPGRGVTALFGPSGSGKTTCLRVLAGLEPAARARVVVGGEVWDDETRGQRLPTHRRPLGYVFQE